MNTIERAPNSPEYESTLTPEVANEQLDRLKEQLNERREAAPELNQEKARHEALEQAARSEKERTANEREAAIETQQTTPRNATKAAKQSSYKATMKETRAHMSPASRTFSKVIHNDVIEKVSETVGNTVARPNAILSGAICAFILTLTLYLIAKHFAYPLSGFETIGAFALGWIIGLLYDFIKATVTGRGS